MATNEEVERKERATEDVPAHESKEEGDDLKKRDPPGTSPGRREKRARKSSEAFKPDDFINVDRSIQVQAGRGVKLGDIPTVRAHLESLSPSSDDVDFAHRFLFKRKGKPPKNELIPNLLAFSGFLLPKVEGQDEETLKIQDDEAEAKFGAKTYKLKVSDVKKLCDFFCIDRTGKQDKDSLVDCLLDFLGEPSPDLVRGSKKAKSSTKGTKVSKTSIAKKKKPKKSKDSDSEETEEDPLDEDGVDEVEADDVDNEPLVKGDMPNDGTLRTWVRAFVQCYNMEKATVKVAVQIASDKFGVDMSSKKGRIRELLTDELSST